MAKQESKNEMHLIRILGTDINANLPILYGLAKIKGVNVMFSNAVCAALKLDKGAKISALSEKDVERIEEFLSNPEMPGIPDWLKNQRKDYETGKNFHLTSKDIDFNMLQFKRRIAKTKSYRAIRHKFRLPLRGQRTKSNFRRNKTLAAMKAKRGGK
jgi:small subunit ribosomal protein S13